MFNYGCLWDVYGRYSCNYSSIFQASCCWGGQLVPRPARNCAINIMNVISSFSWISHFSFRAQRFFFSMFLWIKLQGPSVQPMVAHAEGASCGRLCHIGLTRGSLRRGDFSLDRCLDDVTCCWLCNHLGTLAAMLSLLHLVPLVIFPKFKSKRSPHPVMDPEMGKCLPAL